MSCTNPRGHRWMDRVPLQSPYGQLVTLARIGTLNQLLAADLERRICVQCGARGRVDGHGKVPVVLDGEGRPLEQSTKVQVVPLAQRAKWAQKKTEHDQ